MHAVELRLQRAFFVNSAHLRGQFRDRNECNMVSLYHILENCKEVFRNFFEKSRLEGSLRTALAV